MRRLLALTGFVFLLLPFANARAEGVYDSLLAGRRDELSLADDGSVDIDPELRTFIASLLSEDMTGDDVQDLLAGGMDYCDRHDKVASCDELREAALEVLEREMHVQSVARRLQATAAGAEEPLTDPSAFSAAKNLQNILELWRADGDEFSMEEEFTAAAMTDEERLTALEPVLPDLEPAGNYPAPPDEEGVLCQDERAQDGYLCRPFIPGDAPCAGDDCSESSSVIPPGGSACADVPSMEAGYRNTVGNNVCYLNRRLTQTFTQHRTVPARIPLTSGESVFPFDACIGLPPQPTMAETSARSIAEWSPPVYNPGLLLQTIEERLCPGLPPGDPLCSFDLRRRLEYLLHGGFATASDIQDQEREFLEINSNLNDIAEAIGMRIGNRLYGDYLERRSAVLAEITSGGADALRAFTQIGFPQTLCPFNDADMMELPACLDVPPEQ